MPELPEVETVRRGLELRVPSGTRIARVDLRRRMLRQPVPARFAFRLQGQAIAGFRRLGKYLLWDTEAVVLLSHLGMSGTWRVAPPGDERAHDHCYVELGDGQRLAYHDPRRFGLLELARPGRELEHVCLKGLGPDPLEPERFTAAHLERAFRARRAPVKALLLDQRVVAGLGNIYVAEALFRAGIRPSTPAGRIARGRLGRLVAAVGEVLRAAIAAGGSTLRDFRETGGEAGYFQHQFQVYGREGEPCVRCARPLSGSRLGGRSTAWCRRCQR